MRERALQQFESIFERAAIPVLDVEHIPLTRIAVVHSNYLADEAADAIGQHLAERFSGTVRSFAPSEAGPADLTFTSTAELIGQLRLERIDLVILSLPPEVDQQMVGLDDLVLGTAVPILVVRKQILDPASVFRSILHSLHGNFQQTENFSHSFSLAAPQGTLTLLHTIDQEEIGDVREALRYTGEIDEQGEAQLLDQLRRHGERYLRAVVAAARDEPFEPSYRLEVGPVVATVQKELASGRFSLLVIGKHVEGLSEISAPEYWLMHAVEDVPVLAL